MPSSGAFLSVNTSSFSLSTVQGTASNSTSFTVQGVNLTANGAVTSPGTWLELSLDQITWTSSVTLVQSGGTFGGLIAVFARLTSIGTAGSYLGDILVASTGAVTRHVTVNGTITSPSATISGLPTSLSGFSTTVGSQSGSQSYTLTATNMGTNNVTVTAPANYLVSTDNITFTQFVTVVPSGGSISQLIYAVISSAAPVGSPSGNITNAAVGVSTLNIPVSGTVNAGGIISANFNFSETANTVVGWTNVIGDPGLAIRSATSNGITISTVATANWPSNAGQTAFDNLGQSGGTFFPAQVMLSGDFTYSGGSHLSDSVTLTTSKPQYKLSGLDNTKTYQLLISGSIGPSALFLSTNKYRVSGSATFIGAAFNQQGNTANGTSFATITPDIGGNIFVYLFTEPGQEASVCSGIKITQN